MARRQWLLAGGALSALAVSLVTAKWARRPAPRASVPVALASERPSEPAHRKSRHPPDGKVSEGAPKMLHLDPRHTNRSPFVGPASPTLAWTFDTGGPIEAAPALLDDGTILVTSLSGKMFALSPNGELRYAIDLGERVYASPLVLGDSIYVGSDAHRFFGLTLSGGIRFRLDADHDVDTGAVPTPWGGIVFASGRMVYAARPDGTVLWRVSTRRKCYSSPAVGDNGTVYVGSQDDHFYAIAPDGKIRWRKDLGADVDSAPAIEDDGTVMVGSDKGEVVALAPDDGTVRWRASVGGYVRGALSLARDGTVLVGTYGPAPHLMGLDPDDGSERFSFAIAGTGAPEFGIHGAPVEDAQGNLYFGAQDDAAYSLDGNGVLRWKVSTGGDVDAPLVITPNGLLLLGSDDGKVYAYR